MSHFPTIEFTLNTAPLWSAPAVAAAALLWIWWARRGLDRTRNMRCRDCNFFGHPRIVVFPIRGSIATCPDCNGECLIPVRDRASLHHSQANLLTPAPQQAEFDRAI